MVEGLLLCLLYYFIIPYAGIFTIAIIFHLIKSRIEEAKEAKKMKDPNNRHWECYRITADDDSSSTRQSEAYYQMALIDLYELNKSEKGLCELVVAARMGWKEAVNLLDKYEKQNYCLAKIREYKSTDLAVLQFMRHWIRQ